MIQVVQNVPRGLEGEFRRGEAAPAYLATLQERRAEAALERKPSGGLIVPGYGDMLLPVWAVIQKRNAAKRAQARRDLAGMARRGGERMRVEDGDGGGEWKLQVHPESYHYWGQRLGYECWDDAQFVKEYLRDNEYARIKNVARTARIGWRAGEGYLKRNKKILVKG